MKTELARKQDGTDNSQVFNVMDGHSQNLVIPILPCEQCFVACSQPEGHMDTDRNTVMIVLYNCDSPIIVLYICEYISRHAICHEPVNLSSCKFGACTKKKLFLLFGYFQKITLYLMND